MPLACPGTANAIWRKRAGVEISGDLQIGPVYAALQSPTPLQSSQNITVPGRVGIENNDGRDFKDLRGVRRSTKSWIRNDGERKGSALLP
jgi:hypothetical protein